MQREVSLLKVLIVEDEPYIRKGLTALIDWESEGYEVTGEASNGNNAIRMMKENDYDLILSDIKMPEMDGIELLSYVRNHQLSNAKFVFLSGFYDFHYAKTAIRYGCCDYILKPIQKEELLAALRKIMEEHRVETGSEIEKKVYEKAYLDRQLMAILWGKYDSTNVKYVKEKIMLSSEMAYVNCEISLNDEKFLALPEENRREQQRRLYHYAGLLLKGYLDHIICDLMKHTQCYDIGIIYCSDMSRSKNMTQRQWIDWLQKELTVRVGFEVVACMGCLVGSIHNISASYREAVMLRTFHFYKRNNDKMHIIVKTEGQHVKGNDSRKQLEELIHMIEINDRFKIKEYASFVFRNFMTKEIDPETVEKNIQYLLYRLLGLAYHQDTDIDQEEIMQYIRQSVFTSDINTENGLKFQRFAVEYSDYLAQLRQNMARGTIDRIENDIEENYSENISLKSLGEKYYINSAYLGQVFKKCYGCAFKDYLNNVRIRRAAEMILNTDKKVYEIAIEVGYRNQEYFINKFVEVYGATPTRFRKQSCEGRSNPSKCI